jgi:hypothetical protein
MKIPKWQGNAIVFPALIHHPAWKRVCVKNVFFCVSSRLKSVVVFLAQAHPNRCFCQKLFTFRDRKPRKRYAAGKTKLPKITSQSPEKKTTIFIAKKNTKDRT